ncbi:MAG: hypothetical protein RIQ53_1904 [Pseudomonadota bacterium]
MSAPTRHLRDLTLPEHRHLEGSALARALDDPALNAVRYRALLARWLQAWGPLEQTLDRAPHARALGQLLPAPRTAIGRADLAWLEARLPAAARTPAGSDPGFGLATGTSIGTFTGPSAGPSTGLPALAAPQSVAGALGWAYVLRGAALGGQVIARRLLQRLGPDLAPAVRFFASGEQQALSWTRWQQAADARLADPADLQRATEAARAVFVWLATHFDGPLPPPGLSAQTQAHPAGHAASAREARQTGATA